jgi:hypothetical protein
MLLCCWHICVQVKGSLQLHASITSESVAEDFWELYQKRDPDVWFVKRS